MWSYRAFKTRSARPWCDMCGPFAGIYMRRLFSGEWRCRGCDEED